MGAESGLLIGFFLLGGSWPFTLLRDIRSALDRASAVRHCQRAPCRGIPGTASSSSPPLWQHRSQKTDTDMDPAAGWRRRPLRHDLPANPHAIPCAAFAGGALWRTLA